MSEFISKLFSLARNVVFGSDYLLAELERKNRLPNALKSTGMRIWTPGDPIAESGRRLLVGVSTWSGYDMHMVERVARRDDAFPCDITIEFFDLDSVLTRDESITYFPTSEQWENTPVAGLWNDGKLVQFEQGFRAREFVSTVLQLG